MALKVMTQEALGSMAMVLLIVTVSYTLFSVNFIVPVIEPAAASVASVLLKPFALSHVTATPYRAAFCMAVKSSCSVVALVAVRVLIAVSIAAFAAVTFCASVSVAAATVKLMSKLAEMLLTPLTVTVAV